jgi:fructose-specific phosphotransferase system IIC component
MAPIAVARLVALAKASSAAGAAIGGLLAGYLAYVLGQLDKTIPARDARVAGIMFACAVALVAAALYLEHCCQAPKPPGEDDEDRPYRDSWSWHE